MIFKKEADLERHIRELIKDRIISCRKDLILLDNKKVADIVICRDGDTPAIFFLEVKLYKPSSGRIGIGQGEGKGFQPEVISKKPHYLENNLQWILGHQEKADSYILASTSIINRYLAKGEISEKHNNIQSKIFEEIGPINETELVEELAKFLSQ